MMVDVESSNVGFEGCFVLAGLFGRVFFSSRVLTYHMVVLVLLLRSP